MTLDKREKNAKYFFWGFMVLFIVIFIASFSFGQYPISAKEFFHVMFTKLTGGTPDWSSQIETVIFRIRMPRLIAAALIGAALSASGAAYQGLFQNPMISPDILGASSGAGFGAALSIFLALSSTLLSINAFIFGIISVIIAYIISLNSRQNRTLGLVLAGIMTSSIFTAGTSYIKLAADPTNKLPQISYWLMGSLSGIRWNDILFASFPIVIGSLVLLLNSWKLNLLAMGDDEAASMGLNVSLLRIVIIIAATLISTACVAISGMIGWVGLVIPHFARMIVGYDYRIMLPVSMLIGASFLMVVDNFSRTLSTAEIPIGILISFVGAPFFIYLIIKRGDQL